MDESIPPLNEKQWKFIEKRLDKPSSPEMQRRLKEAIENTKKIKEYKLNMCKGCKTNKDGDCDTKIEDMVTSKVIYCCNELGSALEGGYIREDSCKKYHYDLIKNNEEWQSYFCLKYCPFCGIKLVDGIKYE